MWVKKQLLEHFLEQLTGSKLGKEYNKAVYCHSAYLTVCRVHHVKCWDEDYQEKYQQPQICSHFSNDRKWRATSLLLKVRERKKTGLKLNIQKTKIMVSSPITSWQLDGGKVKTLTDSVFLDSRIIMHSDCSHEIRTLAPSKESYEKPRQHIKKQRH